MNKAQRDLLRAQVLAIQSDMPSITTTRAFSTLSASITVALQLLDDIDRLDHALDASITESERRHDMCDALAQGVASHFNEFIGEHSNANCPWTAALQVLDLKPEFTHYACGAAIAKVDGQ